MYDGRDTLWISDASSPRLWEFSLETQEFTSYSFDGIATTFLTQDGDGKIWFVDTPRNQIGFLILRQKRLQQKHFQNLILLFQTTLHFSLKADFDGNIWITVVNKDKIVKYIPETDEFEEIVLPGKENLPFALEIDVMERCGLQQLVQETLDTLILKDRFNQTLNFQMILHYLGT